MKEIYIIDIDGSIMPALFSNIDENRESRDKIIKKILEKGNGIFLFPEFIEFYEKCCKHAEAVIFITGRQESEFGELTELQLKPLKNIKDFQIIYYPEQKTYKANEYFNWKIKKIQEIFNGKIIKDNNLRIVNNDTIFRIFDDMDDYFPKLKEIVDKLNLNAVLISISDSNTWKSLIN
ncbi:MAG: hypothetical protein ACTSQJ_18815 [Promethearchaeota archaeon]